MIAQIVPLRRMPFSLPYLDYVVPEVLQKTIQIGQLVKIPLRSSSIYGIVLYLTSDQRRNFKNTKAIEEIINLSPVLSLGQLTFLQEISILYQTSLGYLLKNNLFIPQPSKIKRFREEKTCLPAELKKITKPQAHFYSSKRNIKEYIEKNTDLEGQNLILVPEISQAEKIFNLLSSAFQNETICFTSEVGQKAHFEHWLKVWQGKNKIIIGTRSALFLPWSNLKHVFLVNEGDPNHKSWDMAPRFHTRDAVLILSTSHQSQLHLLDHTPSVETYYFSQKKVFVSGSESITALKTDQTTLITISSQNKQSILSETVIEKLTEKNSGIQFIFMHQRGSAHYIFCRDCNFVFSCPECHGSLTFHTRINELQCHTCKYHSPLFTTCFSCQGTNIAMYGTGTEAIEKELKKIFPERNIIRIDSDEPLSDQLIFKEKQTIVIGTQFAWNKLVWKDINLMIYADTDIALTIPEYKTNEHLWYSIRSAEYYLPEEAELYIQTRKPEHLVFSFLTHPEGFYEYELKERRKFKFPPFAYIIKLYYGGTTQTQGEQEAQKIKSKLQDLTNSSQNITISGPIAMKPHVRKKKYWYVLIVKVDYQYYKRDSKRILSHIPDQWKVDLNPNSLLSY